MQSTQSRVLLAVINDVLQRFNVSITKLRGQCYDGVPINCAVLTLAMSLLKVQVTDKTYLEAFSN